MLSTNPSTSGKLCAVMSLLTYLPDGKLWTEITNPNNTKLVNFGLKSLVNYALKLVVNYGA